MGHLDLYTSNNPLTHKAKFWCNYVGALKGSQDLRAPDDRVMRNIHPSIVETLPEEFPDLKHEFSKLESQMFDRPKRPGLVPLTPVLPDANDRICTQDMPTTPSILRSTALTGASHNANKKFSSRNYYYKNYYKKKLHPNNFKNTSANTKPKKNYDIF